jgi:hypothetical protein
MNDVDALIGQIRGAFGASRFPGDAFLQGSFDGCEPYDEVGAFHGKDDWTRLDPAFLDGHYAALSFFSEGGFRFFLPAYLVADLRGQLDTADPVFHLTHGFYEIATETRVGDRAFVLRTGKSTLVNPRRYGASTFEDYARYRLSVFTREEAGAIVAYLQHKHAAAETDLERNYIDAALRAFWLDRARSAPTAASLERHIAEQEEYAAAVRARHAAP